MRILFAAVVLCFSFSAFASISSSPGLVIHTTEFGVGKFHRYDNQVHPYGAANAWTPYILPAGSASDQALTVKNADGSYTVFFSTLDEMMTSVAAISQSTGQKVSVLNVHGHGLPGAMWFPKDAATLNGWMCGDWRQAASGADVDNYNQYYGAVSVSEIMQIRQVSNNPNVHMACTTGANEWRAGVAKNPAFKAAIADDAQLHFISCVVGLGTVGEAFTKDIAAIVLPNGTGHVQTSMAFGLGDWSMPQGMGFWDYQSDAQVNRDNAKYPVDHQDSEIMQKGSIRMASYAGAAWSTSVLADRDFMLMSFETTVLSPLASREPMMNVPSGPVPTRVRIPGTNAYADVIQ